MANKETPRIGVKINQQVEIMRSQLGDQPHETGDTVMSLRRIKLHQRRYPGIVSEQIGISSLGQKEKL